MASPAPAFRILPRLLALVLALTAPGWLATAARAQAPKSGDWHEDTTEIGFKVRVPKGWKFIPPTPGATNVIGKYDGGPGAQVHLSGDRVFEVNAYLLKFDRRKHESGDGKSEQRRARGYKDVVAWAEGAYSVVWRKESSKECQVDGLAAEETVLLGQTSHGNEIGLYVMLVHLEPELDFAFVGDGPGDKKWSKYESAWRQMARTFQRLEVVRAELEEGMGSTLRAQKRVALQNQVASQPGWELLESPNYFIVSNVEDPPFLEELMERLEAIRAVYEVDYPVARVEEIRILALAEAAKRRAEKAAERKAREEAGEEVGEEPADEDEEEGADEEAARPGEGRTVARSADPMERSRTSVVRVCSSREQYISYGGSPVSAGYFHPGHEELVIYDDKAGGGRRDTWIVLNHEAFHQYIFYLYGSIAPHSWYNEGTGDYYSGFQLKNGRFKLKPAEWRVATIRDALREDRFVPLREFVRWSQPEYYGTNKYSAWATGFHNYAQGWSLIYFLRTGEKECKRWNPRWSSILTTYFETLAATKDLEKAVETAFEGVDYDELESAWKEYTL